MTIFNETWICISQARSQCVLGNVVLQPLVPLAPPHLCCQPVQVGFIFDKVCCCCLSAFLYVCVMVMGAVLPVCLSAFLFVWCIVVMNASTGDTMDSSPTQQWILLDFLWFLLFLIPSFFFGCFVCILAIEYFIPCFTTPKPKLSTKMLSFLSREKIFKKY